MIPIQTIAQMNRTLSNHCERGESKIFGVMLARYNIPVVSDAIAQAYSYWNEISGRGFDVFWLGYGEYQCPERAIEVQCNLAKTICYCEHEFVTAYKELQQLTGIKYDDTFTFVLLDCSDGKAIYSDHIALHFEDIDKSASLTQVRKIMNFIIEQSQSVTSISDLRKKLFIRNTRKKILNKIKSLSVSDILGLIPLFT